MIPKYKYCKIFQKTHNRQLLKKLIHNFVNATFINDSGSQIKIKGVVSAKKVGLKIWYRTKPPPKKRLVMVLLQTQGVVILFNVSTAKYN